LTQHLNSKQTQSYCYLQANASVNVCNIKWVCW